MVKKDWKANAASWLKKGITNAARNSANEIKSLRKSEGVKTFARNIQESHFDVGGGFAGGSPSVPGPFNPGFDTSMHYREGGERKKRKHHKKHNRSNDFGGARVIILR